MSHPCDSLCPKILRLAFAAMVCLLAPLHAAEATKPFDIPSADAVVSLKHYAQQSGVELLYSTREVEGAKTNAVKGAFTPLEALGRLLDGTELASSVTKANGAVAITRRPPPNAVRAAPPAAARPDEPVQMGKFDVTVTVQKRPQSAQDVPISMTSLSGYEIERYRIETARDLSRLAPNLLVSSFSQGSPTLAIRGASNTFSQIGVNKPVAVVVDDVFAPRNTVATFELFDLDSVQVLRGPQGTLFGRNVTGGAIVFNTRQPSLSARETEAQLDYGNFNSLRLQGMISAPLTEKIAAKLTVLQHTHDGFGRDRLTGQEEDDQDGSGVRGQLLLRPVAPLKILLSGDYSDDRNGGRTLSSRGLGADGDRRTSELGYPQSFARTMWGLSAHVDWTHSFGDFASITAYRESRSADDYSGVGTSYQFLTAGSQAVSRDLDHPGTFTEELRYASPRGDRFDFVSGIYYLNEDGYRNLTSRAFAARTGALVTNQVASQHVDSRSAAAYLDGVVHLLPALDLTLGGRYTVDRKEASVVKSDAFVAANTFTSSGLSKRWSEFTPRAVLTWAVQPKLRLYASATRGYTAGGFNADAATAAILARPFDPETVTNYEVGVKSSFWGDRLRANVTVFREKYADKQELYFDTLTRILTIVNASKATMKGAEIETRYTPVAGLNLTAAYGLLDASYDTFVVPGVLNYTGNPLGSAPKHKLSLGADYEYRWTGVGFLSATAAYSDTASYYTGATKDPNLFVPSYALVNASLGYQTPDRKWRISLWGRNLGNTDYLLTPSTQVVLAEYLGDPRTYGVSVGVRF
ncbi:MAG: TonB-dependent receptor [Verrucomicrobia bacterium]|nr:TonB-dependent receptor [Verrucomicrobiota bacterium]